MVDGVCQNYGMGKPAARISDATTHAGMIVTGEASVLIGGLPAARKGDATVCLLHGVGRIATHSSTVIIAGSFAARTTDDCACAIVGSTAAGVPEVLSSKTTTWKEAVAGANDQTMDRLLEEEGAVGPYARARAPDLNDAASRNQFATDRCSHANTVVPQLTKIVAEHPAWNILRPLPDKRILDIAAKFPFQDRSRCTQISLYAPFTRREILANHMATIGIGTKDAIRTIHTDDR